MIPFLKQKKINSTSKAVVFTVPDKDFYSLWKPVNAFTEKGMIAFQDSTSNIVDWEKPCRWTDFDTLFSLIFDSYKEGRSLDLAEKFTKTSQSWKLFIDVDARGFDNIDETQAERILSDVVEQMCIFWNRILSPKNHISKEQLTIVEANRLEGDIAYRKLSYHIILTHSTFTYCDVDRMRDDILAFKDYLNSIDTDQTRFFYFDPWAAQKLSIVDSNIYYDFFCLRFLWCSKKNDNRPLNLIQFGTCKWFDFEDETEMKNIFFYTLIQTPTCKI
jgi:hypothetical protein